MSIKDRPITKIYTPYSVHGIHKLRENNTVCNELRRAYKNIEEEDYEAAKLNIRIAASMTKAMATRLKHYHANSAKELFPKDREIQ